MIALNKGRRNLDDIEVSVNFLLFGSSFSFFFSHVVNENKNDESLDLRRNVQNVKWEATVTGNC